MIEDYRPANASFYQNNGQLMVSRMGAATLVQGQTHLFGS